MGVASWMLVVSGDDSLEYMDIWEEIESARRYAG